MHKYGWRKNRNIYNVPGSGESNEHLAPAHVAETASRWHKTLLLLKKDDGHRQVASWSTHWCRTTLHFPAFITPFPFPSLTFPFALRFPFPVLLFLSFPIPPHSSSSPSVPCPLLFLQQWGVKGAAGIVAARRCLGFLVGKVIGKHDPVLVPQGPKLDEHWLQCWLLSYGPTTWSVTYASALTDSSRGRRGWCTVYRLSTRSLASPSWGDWSQRADASTEWVRFARCWPASAPCCRPWPCWATRSTSGRCRRRARSTWDTRASGSPGRALSATASLNTTFDRQRNSSSCSREWENVKVIDKQSDENGRLIREAVWIRNLWIRNSKNMNRDDGSYQRSHLWES